MSLDGKINGGAEVKVLEESLLGTATDSIGRLFGHSGDGKSV